ncbi:MAG: PfkB family carbohydrate kinase [Thermoguttaceae bacterium]
MQSEASAGTAPGFDVLGFGAVAVDDLLYVDEYPPADSKVCVRQRRRECGGLTGTALVAAARLGARCAYVGMLGPDELSRFVADRFGREQIDLSHCVWRDDARPVHSTIVVDRNRGTRNVFASFEGAIGANAAQPPAELIGAAEALLVDHHGQQGTIRAVRIARAARVGVVADLERNPGGEFYDLLTLIDHLIVSASFARQLTGKESPDEAVSALWHRDRQAVVVTGGAQGCWYCGPDAAGDCRHFPAFAVKAVDTTGCGDVFHGAYAAALAWGWPLERRITFASATAALKTTQHGGQSGCPGRQEVEHFLRTGGEWQAS